VELVEKYKTPRRQIVKGLIRQGEVVNIVATPKMRKSFLAMQLGISVANGVPFLGFDTVQGPVLIVDCELHRDDLAARLRDMQRATSLSLDNIQYISLRGQLTDIHALRRELAKLTGYALFILDPMYKLLPAGTDENSNSDMTSVFIAMDAITTDTGSTVVNIHHGTKGNQNHKSAVDMGAGAGSQGRSADVAIALKQHEERDVVVMQASTRSQRPIDDVCLAFNYPLWSVAHDRNPNDLAVAGKKPVPTITEFVELIPTEPENKKELLATIKRKLNTSASAIETLCYEAEKRGLIETIEPARKNRKKTIRRRSAA
jgi:hypothetical protein